MINDAKLRDKYRKELIDYYYNNNLNTTLEAAKRQVNNMDDPVLEATYNRLFFILKDK
jgi:hypothetical protein